jgi:hypothetical protein
MLKLPKGFAAVIAVVAVFAMASTAKAVPINHIVADILLSQGGTGTVLMDDEDRSVVYSADATLGVGDVIRAPFSIAVMQPGNHTAIEFTEITGIFHGVVTGVVVDGGGNTVVSLAPDAAFGTYAGDHAGAAPPPNAAYGAGAMLAIYQDTASNADGDGVAPGGAGALGSTGPAETDIATYTDGTLWGVFGIPAGSPGFYTITIKAASGVGTSLLAAAAKPALTTIGASFADVSFALDRLALGLPANSVNMNKDAGTGTDIVGNGGLWGADGNLAVGGIQPFAGHWAVGSDAKISFNATIIPLPAAVYPGMLLLGALGVFKARRKVKA